MVSQSFPAVFALSCLLVTIQGSVHAQSAGGAAAAQQPGYTFQAGTRIVLTDVTVSDKKGKPVHGLRASDFHIFDNNKPQFVASFEEHTTTPVALFPQPSTAPGVYSNNFLLYLPPVLNVIVIDIANLEIVDQMYLNYELSRFVKNLPPGRPLAIYWHTGPSSILLQAFTSDHALLLAAIREAIPHFPPTGREYYTDFATLHQIALDLAQFPGRKNILWFSGGSTLFLRRDATIFENQDQLRHVYDELEAGRIAIYPVDARGLTLTADPAMWNQHALMNDIAEATGGRAFYNNNGLDLVAAHWVDNGGSFYSLSYSPSDFRFDNKWHKVRVKLNADGSNYTLSYRQGYFADGSVGSVQQPKKPRTRLLAGGETVTEPDVRSIPLIFQARVLPAWDAPPEPAEAGSATPAAQPPKKGTSPYSIQYSLPADSFSTTMANGNPQITAGVAAFAFNEDGSPVARVADRFTITVNGDRLRRTPNPLLTVHQQINLRKGQNYLYLAVWDMASGRLGTLQIPLKVAAPPKERKP